MIREKIQLMSNKVFELFEIHEVERITVNAFEKNSKVVDEDCKKFAIEGDSKILQLTKENHHLRTRESHRKKERI